MRSLDRFQSVAAELSGILAETLTDGSARQIPERPAPGGCQKSASARFPKTISRRFSKISEQAFRFPVLWTVLECKSEEKI